MLLVLCVLSLRQAVGHVPNRDRVTIGGRDGDGLESKASERVSQRAGGMVPRPPARSALAPRRRSLSRLDLGNHAAADARGGGHPVLSAFFPALSDGAAPGARAGEFGAGGLER